MVLKHNETSAGSGISRRNPNPNRERASNVKESRGRQGRIERARERMEDDLPSKNTGLRRAIKDGNVSCKQIINQLDGNISLSFLQWLNRRR